MISIWKTALFLDIATTYSATNDYQQAIYFIHENYPSLKKSFLKLKESIKKLISEDRFYKEYENVIDQTKGQLPEIISLLSYDFIYSSMEDPLRGKVYGNLAKYKTLKILKEWRKIAGISVESEKTSRYIKTIVDFLGLFITGQSVSDQQVELKNNLSEILDAFDKQEDVKQFLLPYLKSFLPILISQINQANDEQIPVTLSQVISSLNFSMERKSDIYKKTLEALIFSFQGAAYFRLGKYWESIKSYQDLYTLSKRGTLSSIDQGNNDNSCLNFTSNPPDQFYFLDSTLSIPLALGKLYDALGDSKNAFICYRRVLELPTRAVIKPEAHYSIARLELFLNHPLEAQAQISQAIAVSQTIAESEDSQNTFGGNDYGSGFSSATWTHGYGLEDANGKGRSSIVAGFGVSSKTLNLDTATTDKPDPANPCNTLSAYFACKQKYFEFQIDLLFQERQRANEVKAFEASERARAFTVEAFQKGNSSSRTDQASGGKLAGQSTSSKKRSRGFTRPAALSEIQSLLDDNTLLLEYFLGEKTSYLWAVSKNSLKTYSLPGRSTIELKAKAFYDLLTAPPGRVKPKTTAQAGKELSNLLLGQVTDQLGQKRLLIVGDGILQYIPFGALPDPAAKPDSSQNALKGEFAPYMQPLLVNHEINNLLSASAIVQQRQDQNLRPTPAMELATFADPVFNFDDERVKQLAIPAITARQQNPVIKSEILEPIYTRLPGTQTEVEQISQFVPVEKRAQFSGFDATYQTAISQLSQYRRIHFATHGFFNTKSPERSGIVLSAIQKDGELQRGAITPAATFDMDLSAAELVVLSGCRTGLSGDLIREGLTGLTGGLMSAGAKQVVASLWSVNDEATEKLMTLFYQNMYKNKFSPTQALRSAQISLWQDARWQTPYNWAAFTIYGDWQ